MRLRVYQGYQIPILTLVSDADEVEIIVDEGEKRVVVEWKGNLAELAEALKKDNEEKR